MTREQLDTLVSHYFILLHSCFTMQNKLNVEVFLRADNKLFLARTLSDHLIQGMQISHVEFSPLFRIGLKKYCLRKDHDERSAHLRPLRGIFLCLDDRET